MIAFLFIVVVIVVVGAAALAYRHRPESSIESGISSFRREMRALAPPGQRRPSAPAPGDDDGVVRPPDHPRTDPGPDGPRPGAG